MSSKAIEKKFTEWNAAVAEVHYHRKRFVEMKISAASTELRKSLKVVQDLSQDIKKLVLEIRHEGQSDKGKKATKPARK
jgi:hypothetical protein